MAKKPRRKQKPKSDWAERQEITPHEALARMRSFGERKEASIAAVRKASSLSHFAAAPWRADSVAAISRASGHAYARSHQCALYRHSCGDGHPFPNHVGLRR